MASEQQRTRTERLRWASRRALLEKEREEQKAKREEALKTAVSQSLQTQLARGLEAWLGTKASDSGAGKEQQKS
jgi:hypothetical protein